MILSVVGFLDSEHRTDVASSSHALKAYPETFVLSTILTKTDCRATA